MSTTESNQRLLLKWNLAVHWQISTHFHHKKQFLKYHRMQSNIIILNHIDKELSNEKPLRTTISGIETILTKFFKMVLTFLFWKTGRIVVEYSLTKRVLTSEEQLLTKSKRKTERTTSLKYSYQMTHRIAITYQKKEH